jgi:hypothetical protein
MRPAQKLFDPDMVRMIGGVPVKEKENWIFENNRYTPKGFLLKNFPLSTVVSKKKFLFYLVGLLLTFLIY